MNRSPIVDEIRAIREEHARSCGFDLKRIVEDIRLTEERLRAEGWNVVTEHAGRRTSIESKTNE